MVWTSPTWLNMSQGLSLIHICILRNFETVESLTQSHKVLAAYTPTYGGLAEALFKMTLGNHIGLVLEPSFPKERLFGHCYGSFVLELAEDLDVGEPLGRTVADFVLTVQGETLDLMALQAQYEGKLEPVLPYHTPENHQQVPTFSHPAAERVDPKA